jgi:hypothetical protein
MPVEGRSRCGNCDGERETCELNSTLSKRPLGPVRDRADAAAAQLPLPYVPFATDQMPIAGCHASRSGEKSSCTRTAVGGN